MKIKMKNKNKIESTIFNSDKYSLTALSRPVTILSLAQIATKAKT